MSTENSKINVTNASTPSSLPKNSIDAIHKRFNSIDAIYKRFEVNFSQEDAATFDISLTKVKPSAVSICMTNAPLQNVEDIPPHSVTREEIDSALSKRMAETPFGCGGCGHAEWITQENKFAVGLCRKGIKLEHAQLTDENHKTWSLAGYTPALFCTAQNS
ncbi:hypothetical protein H8K32_13890 [Undibacterium jejuense]|uniref:Uncharacterized protein n=1 Tax=Undibacterium jejuense TaxID=1344949 RepID=A0A923HP88_9BURK|nr:hypothetical protein [Undibacterium jejuense]MBC3863196.1 hypothetical protein [Undibacterium jejuense]